MCYAEKLKKKKTSTEKGLILTQNTSWQSRKPSHLSRETTLGQIWISEGKKGQ
jgi:hypothetical protein